MNAPTPEVQTPELTEAVKNLRFWVTIPAWASLATALILSLVLPPDLLRRISLLPFLVSLLFLGLPHGAWDHRVMSAAERAPLRLTFVAAFCVIYLALVAAYGALWPLAPTVAYLLFIAMSWLHWGQGDAAYLRIWGHARTGRMASLLVWLVRGGAPIALPILTHPQAFAQAAADITSRFRDSSNLTPVGPELWKQWLPPLTCRVGLFVLGALVVLYLIRSFQSNGGWESAMRHKGKFREDAGEVGLLYTVFAFADPIFAIGIYFCLWHGLRHIARLLLLDDNLRSLCSGGYVGAAALRFGQQTLLIMGASLSLLGGVYLYWAPTVQSVGGFVSLYLALIAALTFPHFLLTIWLDARRPDG
jgi:Brp/Blh family beta-carotene 15,15'-monooxygenase